MQQVKSGWMSFCYIGADISALSDSDDDLENADENGDKSYH